MWPASSATKCSRNSYIETQLAGGHHDPRPRKQQNGHLPFRLYHEYKRSVSRLHKFETFPIWNIPLKHPVNLAYEAATADLNDVNMIDRSIWKPCGVTVNYNRDIEIFLR